MVAAPIVRGREADLRTLLLTMNHCPGTADPNNLLVPFAAFDTLHFARFVILNDATLGDLSVFGADAEFPDAPVYLAFLGDCDGPAELLLADFAHRAGDGLRKIFAYCVGFDPNGDLLDWMRRNSVKAAASYVNWIGRTVRQIREEAALHDALANHLAWYPTDRIKDEPRQIHIALVRAVSENGPRLTPPAATPLGWQMRRLRYILAAAAAAFIVALPLLLLSPGAALLVYCAVLLMIGAVAGVFLVCLRRHETTALDLRGQPKPPSDQHLLALGALQDHDVTNQYTALGSFRPGPLSRWTTTIVWWLVNLATPILYPRGNLGRIKTIHFARWVFLDGKRRGMFASNYDGSSESYMDDFVNKVAFGLNLTFGQGVGYPRTRFLLSGGAALEQDFKNTQRRHSLPTEVWYKAYPGLTLFDIARNTRIRQGLERTRMTETEIRQWLAEI
jgi:hypothetical protein